MAILKKPGVDNNNTLYVAKNIPFNLVMYNFHMLNLSSLLELKKNIGSLNYKKGSLNYTS